MKRKMKASTVVKGVLIILWLLAARSDKGYLSVVVCFAVFLVNDIYGFLNWRRMEKKQASASS